MRITTSYAIEQCSRERVIVAEGASVSESLRQKKGIGTHSWRVINRVADDCYSVVFILRRNGMSDLKKTPLFDAYEASGAKVVDFHGWALPVQFSSIKEEHVAVRDSVGMFDVSHMGEIKVSGPEAEAFLNYALTNDVSKLSDDKAQYTVLANEQGGTIDDLVLYKVGENEYLLVVNAGNVDKDFEVLSAIEGFDAKVENVSAEFGQLAIQGPRARAVVQLAVEESIGDMKMFNFKRNIQVAGYGVILSQSGYTGEDGFEIYCRAEDTVGLWNHFLEAGVTPCGLGARDTLRLEAGLPLHGQDLTEEISPLEAKIGFAVKLNKESDFVGKQALVEQKENGVQRTRAGFEILERGIARTGYEVLDSKGNVIGEVTSGTQSPSSKRSIGFALVDTDAYELDKEFYIKVRKNEVRARFVSTPFHKYN